LRYCRLSITYFQCHRAYSPFTECLPQSGLLFSRPISTDYASLLPYSLLTQRMIWNDPTIQFCYIHASILQPSTTKSDHLQSTHQKEWSPPITAHHPTTTNRPPHCDDYTTALSCIPWDPLTQLQPLLLHHSYWQRDTGTYTYDIPTRFLTATVHDPFQTLTRLKFYSKIVSFLNEASSLAYLPALTTKFRGWIRLWHRPAWPSSQYRTVPPRPATSDKNLLRPP